MHAHWIILAICAASVTAFQERKLCEKFNEEIAAAFDKCNSLVSEEVFKIIHECREEALSDALPETVDKTYSYLVAACEDHSKFGKFSYCMGGHIQKGEITDASMSDLEKCYGEVEEKYDVGPERPMFRVG